MLEIFFSEYELFDEKTQTFTTMPEGVYHFSYTLLALDKWESEHRKRLIDNKDVSREEFIDFFKIMCIEEDFDPIRITPVEFGMLRKYLDDNPTATIIPNNKNSGGRKTILTSEIIYGYMAIIGIPYEWENRNLNKLLTLINTVSSLQSPPKKMSKSEAMDEQKRIILERRAMRKAKENV